MPMLINRILVPENLQGVYLHPNPPGDNIFKLTWYLKEFNDRLMLVNEVFGLIVVCNRPANLEIVLYHALKNNAPDEVPFEDYFQINGYWGSYTDIPEPLNSRVQKSDNATSLHDIEKLNYYKRFRPDAQKYGKSKTPAEWIHVLFESIDHAHNIYSENCGTIRRWWHKLQGARPWMIAYYAVKIGFPYDDIIRSKYMPSSFESQK